MKIISASSSCRWVPSCREGKRLTFQILALGQVVVHVLGQERIAVTPDDTLQESVRCLQHELVIQMVMSAAFYNPHEPNRDGR